MENKKFKSPLLTQGRGVSLGSSLWVWKSMAKSVTLWINHYRNRTTPTWNFVISSPKYKPQWYHPPFLEQTL